MEFNFFPFSLLTIAFIVLRLCDVIAWSWFWVLSPVIIPLLIFGLILFVMVVFFS